MSSPVPFVDLAVGNQRIADQVWPTLRRVVDSNGFVLGDATQQFEQEYAQYCETAHCVGVGNGTDAIEIALRAAGVGAGDEVIIPANTFVATAEGVVRAGATVVLADVTADHLLDPGSVAAHLTPRTRAVVAVHLYGQVAPMAALAEVVGSDVLLIEDAAQSQGARQGGRRSGSLGTVAATSFYPGKNLGAFGDAGALTTDDPDIALRARELRNHGGIRRYEHDVVGLNSRLDGLQAVVLSAKLAVLDSWNDERRAAAARYVELLGDLPGLELPVTRPDNEHVWHLFVVSTDRRDEVSDQLAAAGIGVGIHYPRPIHLLPAFAFLGHQRGAYPAAERACDRILSLPMFPGITEDQQQRVADVLERAVAGRRSAVLASSGRSGS